MPLTPLSHTQRHPLFHPFVERSFYHLTLFTITCLLFYLFCFFFLFFYAPLAVHYKVCGSMAHICHGRHHSLSVVNVCRLDEGWRGWVKGISANTFIHISFRSYLWGQWDGTVGEGVYLQVWWPEFTPGHSRIRSRKPTPSTYPLVSEDTHSFTYVHT